MIDLARVTMPLVQLMIEAELSWFQRDLIAQAIQRALTCHHAMENERRLHQQSSAAAQEAKSLANKKHLEAFLACLVAQGAMCPKCGFGTRATSRRWAKCKRCGERCERRKLPD